MQTLMLVSDLLDMVIFQALSGNPDYVVRAYKHFPSAFAEVNEHAPKIVIIDSDRHESETAELLHQIRNEPHRKNINTFIVSSTMNSRFEVEAFQSGVNDFIRKPISKEALWARINARCGESVSADKTATPVIHHRVKIDREAFAVYLDGNLVPFSRKEFELLYLLYSHPERVFTREEIFRKVWNRGDDEKDRTIDVHILRLRRKLGATTIQTQKGIGYRFVNNRNK